MVIVHDNDWCNISNNRFVVTGTVTQDEIREILDTYEQQFSATLEEACSESLFNTTSISEDDIPDTPADSFVSRMPVSHTELLADERNASLKQTTGAKDFPSTVPSKPLEDTGAGDSYTLQSKQWCSSSVQ